MSEPLPEVLFSPPSCALRMEEEDQAVKTPANTSFVLLPITKIVQAPATLYCAKQGAAPSFFFSSDGITLSDVFAAGHSVFSSGEICGATLCMVHSPHPFLLLALEVTKVSLLRVLKGAERMPMDLDKPRYEIEILTLLLVLGPAEVGAVAPLLVAGVEAMGISRAQILSDEALAVSLRTTICTGPRLEVLRTSAFPYHEDAGGNDLKLPWVCKLSLPVRALRRGSSGGGGSFSGSAAAAPRSSKLAAPAEAIPASATKLVFAYPFNKDEVDVLKAEEAAAAAMWAPGIQGGAQDDVQVAPAEKEVEAGGGAQAEAVAEMAGTRAAAGPLPAMRRLAKAPQRIKACVKEGDLAFIKGKEFLNDSLIEFWMLLLWHRSTESAEERALVQPLTSFLYNKMLDAGQQVLGKKDGAVAEGETTQPEEWGAEQFDAAHSSVSTWMRGIDLFSKDALFNPVNYGLHWSLVTVINAPSLHAYLTHVDAKLRQVSGVQKPSGGAQGAAAGAAMAAEEMEVGEGGEAAAEEVPAVGERLQLDSPMAPEHTAGAGVRASIILGSDSHTVPEVDDGDAGGDEAIEVHDSSPCSPAAGQEEAPRAPTQEERYAQAIASVPLPDNRPLLLHADSLGCHLLERVGAVFREWLVREWCARKNGGQPVGGNKEAQGALGAFKAGKGGSSKGRRGKGSSSSSSSSGGGAGSSGGGGGGGEDERRTLRGYWLDIVPEASLQGAPKQDNSYDCGVYTVRYVESVLEMLRGPWAAQVPEVSAAWRKIRWPESIDRFEIVDINATRRLIKDVIGACRVEKKFMALSLPRAGPDEGDGALLECWDHVLAQAVQEEEESSGAGGRRRQQQQMSALPGWMVKACLAQRREGGGAGAGAGAGGGGGQKRSSKGKRSGASLSHDDGVIDVDDEGGAGASPPSKRRAKD